MTTPANATRAEDKSRLSLRITDEIRRLIQKGDYNEGDRLPSERQLAEDFAVSRMVVREALRQLEEAGLITTRKGRYGGAFVTSVSSPVFSRTLGDMVGQGNASVDHMLEARAGLMRWVVRLACQRRSDNDLVALQYELERVRKRVDRDEDMELRTQQALNFNVVLARATYNPVLVNLVQALTDTMVDLVRPIRPKSYAPIGTFYQSIVDSIRLRAEDAAEAAMADYLAAMRDELHNESRS